VKIYTSNINLLSERTFSEKKQVKIEKEMRFANLFNQKLISTKLIEGSIMENELQTSDLESQWFALHPLKWQPVFKPGNQVLMKNEQVTSRLESQWFALQLFNGQQVFKPSSQFLDELGKMKELLDVIVSSVNKDGLRGSVLQMVDIDRLNINPLQQSRVDRMEYTYIEQKTYTHHEQENTNFFSDGVVKTMDGRSIDFSFQMNLEREFFQEDQFKLEEKGYVMLDPLIINFNTTTPVFSEASISFDLDMDGTNEDIPTLLKGSGFLSFDKNQDGIINNGSELFGPSTGNGFAELSEYDLDHNSWIDENDAIFDDLTIWENDNDGEMHLTKIKDAGIGAIYLASAPTLFDMKNDENLLIAKIKNSGIALNEDGSVSSIQEIDWTA